MRRKIKRISALKNIMIIGLSIFALYLLYSYIFQGKSVLLSVLLIINIFGIIFLAIKYLNQAAKYSELEEKYKIQKLQSDLLFDNYNELIKENDEKEKVLHDIQNHLNTLSELTELKVSPLSLNYTREIKQSLKNSDWRYHYRNEVLEAILNSKRRICEYHQIKLSFTIREDGLEVIEPYDLIIILGNLLDNSIEGCFNHPDKRIEIRIYSIENFLNIYIKNTYTGEIIKNRLGKFQSTKQGHKGIGMQNVGEAIKKYEGFIKYDINEQEFIVKITIPMQ